MERWREKPRDTERPRDIEVALRGGGADKKLEEIQARRQGQPWPSSLARRLWLSVWTEGCAQKWPGKELL